MIVKLFGLVLKYWNIVCYLFFGVCATLVNWAVYYALVPLGVDPQIANAVGWVVGTVFAFITERKTAFDSQAENAKDVAHEAAKFFAGRVGVWAIEQGLLWVGLNVLHINKYIVKIPLAAITAVLNFVFGKLVAFRKGKRSAE